MITPEKRALRVAGHELAALADDLPNPAWVAYADGYIFWYTPGTTSPEQMEGWRWSAVHHPDELERVTEIWTKAIAAGKAVELTFPLKSKDGSCRPFLTRVVPIRDASGAVIRWIGTDVDISAQVAAEERLREAKRNWRNLFDEMQEGFAVIEFERDHSGEAVDAIVVKVNRQWEAHTGLPTDQVIGRPAITVAAENRLERAKIYADVVATAIRASLRCTTGASVEPLKSAPIATRRPSARSCSPTSVHASSPSRRRALLRTIYYRCRG